jgi:hypothetical protein
LNPLTAKLYAFTCPECFAEPGQRCTLTSRVPGQLVHRGRRALVPVPVKIPDILTRPEPIIKAGFSDYCKKRHCERCKGMRKMGHGIKLACTCPCHKLDVRETR